MESTASLLCFEGSIFIAEVPFSGFVMVFVMVENSPESEKYARDSHNDDEVYVVPALQV